MYEQLEDVLNTHVRPLLRAHGGDMEIVSIEDGVLRFTLKGACSGCPAADLTTEELIQTEVAARLPGIERAVLVRETNPDLLAQARAILQARHGG